MADADPIACPRCGRSCAVREVVAYRACERCFEVSTEARTHPSWGDQVGEVLRPTGTWPQSYVRIRIERQGWADAATGQET